MSPLFNLKYKIKGVSSRKSLFFLLHYNGYYLMKKTGEMYYEHYFRKQ